MRRWFRVSAATVFATALLIGCEQKPAGSGGGNATTAREAGHSGKTHDHDHDHAHDGHDHAKNGKSDAAASKPASDGGGTTSGEAEHDCSGHKAPRGGTLVPLGNHFAHLEVLLDKDAGRLDIYVLDGHAEHALRSKSGKLDLTVRVTENASGPVAEPKPISLTVPGVGSALSGESPEDTSHFSFTSDALKGAAKIDATVVRIAVKGEELSAIRFSHPAGK
ncbi:MAG: hypothetical protein ACKVS9_12085 [Phycisphaerae bacterium]